ncbi:xanthine dehydrogenase, molybdenum binding subunit apoprotein [Hymenobacter roseosalivarius DSM 11622]|uniref:Xanthine dehydrogenase, molybdenum binding subunit apoprotein n=1 Tax=Hymenobacter roseosalivarius DSM 11622 TaxID=645990 RepID=A0A1W1VVG8_9BACT|nr:xanthine dehydrogenase family protein molybdopterin-binding subunit [Hymenobacter roseosalivarius]SMB97375.1 xanthine dehydrogenase, molybdenum binding subunit apoprotein [Hymenobacter roseosalivarius DSM 11622]
MNEPNFFESPGAGGSVGQPLDRVDGHDKVTGKARYSAEFPLPGLTYGVLRTSEIAKGKITSIDTTAATKEPGVIAVLTHLNLPKLAQTPNTPEGKKAIGAPMGFLPLTSDEIHYAGQPVALIVADTFERATHAASLVRVQYQAAQPIASFLDAKAEIFDPLKVQDGKTPGHTRRGDPQAALAASAVKLKATYNHAINHHNPMEPGATTAHWEAADRLTVYESTQGVTRTQTALSQMLGLPREQVRVVTKYIGGGFGCKGSCWPHTPLTVQAAKAVGRPVKLVLTRPQMFTSMGHREDQTQTLTLGATKEGKLTALIHEKTSTTSPWDNYAEPNSRIINLLYECPNFEAKYELARANVMTSTFTRAPGEAPGSFAIECLMDDLAYQLGIDPIQLRLLNYAEKDPSTGKPWSSKSLKQCYARGAELFGWSKRNPKNGLTRDGRHLVGLGMATASYPVHNSQGTARVRLYADGHAVVQSGATDLGTGTYTVMTQVAADSLGLPVDKIRFELGDTRLPTAPNSGGSVAAGTVSSSIYMAAQDVWQKLTKLAIQDKRSPLFRAKPEDVINEKGRLVLRKDKAKGEDFAVLMKRIELTDIEGTGNGKYGAGYESGMAASPADSGHKDDTAGHSMHSFGAHFCEVRVDPELGTVRVSRWVSVHAAGRILNAKTARSQIIGGSIFGIGNALMEATHRDDTFARYTNATLADYHIPVNADIPEMTVEFIEEHDPYINAMGVKGIGEISMVGVAAAVANAVFHATGKRVRDLPITPDKILSAGVAS